MARDFSDEPAATTSGKAIASVILGIVGFGCPLLPAIAGLILGILGLKDVSSSGGRIKGQGLSIAGIVLSAAAMLFSAVAIPLLAIVLGLSLPAATKVRGAANRARSMNNLKQCALAHHNYASNHQDRLPAAIVDGNARPLLSWRVAILPEIGQPVLYQRFSQQQDWDGPNNSPLLPEMPRDYLDPAEKQGTETPYRSFVGPGTLFPKPGYQTPYVIANIPDGTSNTILMVEASAAVSWSKPEELLYVRGQMMPQLGNPGRPVFLVAMCDGSVRGVNKTISEKTLHSAICPDDGQPLGPDW